MPAAYDKFDYPSYWKGRDYEHESEIIAIESFLGKIQKINTIVEVGAGFGRLMPTYLFRAKKSIVTDPSAKLLKMARENIQSRKIKFIQTSIENISSKVYGKTADLTIMVRVLHHIEDPQRAIKEIAKITKPKGYLIMEFANKSHFKASIREALKGNITYLLDIFPKDMRSKKAIKRHSLPFFNFHPDIIQDYLKEEEFEIIEKRSVSNIRSTFIKKRVPLPFLLKLEAHSQKFLAALNFGPSIFILARKK